MLYQSRNIFAGDSSFPAVSLLIREEKLSWVVLAPSFIVLSRFCRFPCCVLLALSWNRTYENPSTDKLSRTINYNSSTVTKIDDFLYKKPRKNVYKRLKGKKIDIVALEAAKSLMTDPRQKWEMYFSSRHGTHVIRSVVPKTYVWLDFLATFTFCAPNLWDGDGHQFRSFL